MPLHLWPSCVGGDATCACSEAVSGGYAWGGAGAVVMASRPLHTVARSLLEGAVRGPHLLLVCPHHPQGCHRMARRLQLGSLEIPDPQALQVAILELGESVPSAEEAVAPVLEAALRRKGVEILCPYLQLAPSQPEFQHVLDQWILKVVDSASLFTGALPCSSAGGCDRNVQFVYASQLGNAQEIARIVYEEARSVLPGNVCCKLSSIQDIDVNQFPTASSVVFFVCSTTGEGEPPDSARSFFRFLKGEGHPADLCKGVSYSVLALGDTNYTFFCRAGIRLDQGLSALGAHRLIPRIDADDATGQEEAIESWRAEVVRVLRDLFGEKESASTPSGLLSANKKPAEPAPAKPGKTSAKPGLFASLCKQTDRVSTVDCVQAETLPSWAERVAILPCPEGGSASWTGTRPFFARVAAGKQLTSAEAPKQTDLLTLDLSGSGIVYNPGDALGIVCPNPEDLVLQTLEQLNLNPQQVVHCEAKDCCGDSQERQQLLSQPWTLQALFTHMFDISSVTRPMIRVLAEYAKNLLQKRTLMELCSKRGEENYWVNIWNAKITLLEMLRMFPSSTPPLGHLLDVLPPLNPRFYSVASSPLLDPKLVDIAFSVVQYEIGPPHPRPKLGLCSNWLHSIVQQCVAGESDSVPLVPVFLRPGSEFHLATTREEATSVVMVGPGTGVAPFRAYLQHLHHLSEAGHPIPTTTLYFGCRKSDWDFLFAEELQNFHQSRTLGDLRVALSREQTGPAWYCGKYVQDLMLEDASSLYRLLTTPNMSQLVVCGDAVSMAKDVRRILKLIIMEEGDKSGDEAQEMLDKLIESGCIQQDVWS